jgi:curli biogenesis system outer membrane secretion channel CsgG
MRAPYIFMIGVAAALCAPAPAAAPDAGQAAYPAYQGPKKTIAVSKFDASGAFVARYGGWDIGGGLAAMLASELARTNRFIVIERADLDTLLREKQMALSDVTQGASTAPLLGVQTFVRGSVTEFDQQEKGGGLKLGVATDLGQGALGRRQASGHVAIDLRLIDAATGSVIATKRVEKKISNASMAVDGSSSGLSFGGDAFEQTSLGRAAREAIRDATAAVVADMERVPWQGLVATVDGERIYVNAGRNANLGPGLKMRAVRRERTITDPATGEVLGGEQRTIGDLVIEQVEDRYAVGRWLSHDTPQRGDVVQILGD